MIMAFTYAGFFKADRGIPVPSLLELLRVKVPRSGNVENRKKEEILLRLDKDYTTSQIADYVHKTGDERGISQLFIDMIHDGQVIPNIFSSKIAFIFHISISYATDVSWFNFWCDKFMVYRQAGMT